MEILSKNKWVIYYENSNILTETTGSYKITYTYDANGLQKKSKNISNKVFGTMEGVVEIAGGVASTVASDGTAAMVGSIAAIAAGYTTIVQTWWSDSDSD